MSVESLLGNRKASRIFLCVVRKPSRPERLARECQLSKTEAERLAKRMQRAGLLEVRAGSYRIDFNRFFPIFLHHAMGIYRVAMPWRFMSYYMEKKGGDFIEASCARSERELARIKVKLANSDLFVELLKSYLLTLASETSAPDDYLEDIRLSDIIAEFEYALLKLVPDMRKSKGFTREGRELFMLLKNWYDALQRYDTPLGTALREAFHRQGLL
jgi:hypothetical protein